MNKYGFLFKGLDIYELYGIKVESVGDVLHPKARERKLEIPGRSGAYEFDYDDYDERTLTLTCSSSRELSNAERRELGYLLSKRGEITLPREPDKYYIGRLYDPRQTEEIGQTIRKYELAFTCDPFLYGEVREITSLSGLVPINYAGTAKTPCRISVKNNGESPVSVILVNHIVTES